MTGPATCPRRRVFSTLIPFALSLVFAACVCGQQPLHERIDEIVERALVGTPTEVAGDAEFVRRVYLDLTGRVPPPDVVRAFLDDAAADKRVQLVDRLMATPEFLRHLTISFDVMLMERRPDKHVPGAEWRQYLYESLATEKPYNQLAREILSSDGVDPALRPAAKFYLDREAEPNLLTRDVGRIFLGMDLQCAQCHDHPLIDSYYQRDYYGLFAYLGRTVLFVDAKDKNKAYLGEKADGDTKFVSVFTKEEGMSRPRLPTGRPVDDPIFAKDDAYLVAPAKDVRPVPKYSRRQRLAEEATRGDNLAFNRNLANRLWALVMGRGLVDPVDLHNTENPPANARLLDELAQHLVDNQFNVRDFLRELVLSRTYQRSIDLPGDWRQQMQLAAAALLESEAQVAELKDRLKTAQAEAEQVRTSLTEQQAAIAPQRDARLQAEQARADADKAARDAVAALAATKTQLETQRGVHTTVAEALEAAGKAAALLPDEAELKGAVAKFQASADKLAAELKGLEDMMPGQQKAIETTAAALTQADQAFDAARQAHEAAAMPLAGVEKQLADAERRALELEHQLTDVQRQAKDAQLLTEAQPLFEAANAARALVTQRAAERDVAEQTLAKARQQLESARGELATARQAHEELLATTASSRGKLAELKQAHELLTTAVARVRDAQKALPGDAVLQSAADDLAARDAALARSVTDMSASVAQQEATCEAAQTRVVTLDEQAANSAAQVAAHEKHLAELAEQCRAAEEQLAQAEEVLQEPMEKFEEAFVRQSALAPLKPLTPEQLGWSILEVTGNVARQRQASEDELKKKADAPTDPVVFARELEKAVNAKLEGNITEFVRLFGGGAGQPQHVFFATVDQALFFDNGGQLRSWLAPAAGSVTERMLKLDDPAAIADELYVSVLARRPSEHEIQMVRDALAAQPEQKGAVVQELAWALITSAEFRFSP